MQTDSTPRSSTDLLVLSPRHPGPKGRAPWLEAGWLSRASLRGCATVIGGSVLCGLLAVGAPLARAQEAQVGTGLERAATDAQAGSEATAVPEGGAEGEVSSSDDEATVQDEEVNAAAQSMQIPALSEAGFNPAAARDPNGLTAKASAERALATSVSLKAAEQSVEAARAGAAKAFLGVFPRLELSARYTRISDVDQTNVNLGGGGADAAVQNQINAVQDPNSRDLFNTVFGAFAGFSNIEFPLIQDQFAFRASLTYPVSDVFFTILPSYSGAQSAAKAEQARYETEKASVALHAREAFFHFALAQGALVVAESSVVQMEAHAKQVDALVRAGVAARVDAMRIQAQLASTQVAVAKARAGVATAEGALRMLLHMGADEQPSVGQVLTDLPAPVTESRDALVSRALGERGELKALTELIEAQESFRSAARAGMYPRLAVQGNWDYANPNQRVFPQTPEFRSSWDVSAVLSWSPNDAFANSAETDKVSADLAKARADYEALSEAIELEVVQTYENFRAAQAALDAAKAGIAAAEEGYRVRAEQLRAGTAVTSDLIDAETELTRSRLEFLNALIDLHLAHARLKHAIHAGA